MYGMVNKAVEDMVVLHHGQCVWAALKARAAVAVEVFMSNDRGVDHDIFEVGWIPALQ